MGEIMRKEFRKGYYCVSLFWVSCQLDCSDCDMLRKIKGVGINGEKLEGKGKKEI